jgi:hypothetical protein
VADYPDYWPEELSEEERASLAEFRAVKKRSLWWRNVKEWVFEIIWVALAVVPWWFSFGRTDMIAWYFGLVIVWQLVSLITANEGFGRDSDHV